MKIGDESSDRCFDISDVQNVFLRIVNGCLWPKKFAADVHTNKESRDSESDGSRVTSQLKEQFACAVGNISLHYFGQTNVTKIFSNGRDQKVYRIFGPKVQGFKFTCSSRTGRSEFFGFLQTSDNSNATKTPVRYNVTSTTTESPTPKDDCNFMGKYSRNNSRSCSVDGRFLFCRSNEGINMIDLFHTQTRNLHFDVSSATVEGSSLVMNVGELWIHDVFALNLYTILSMFRIGNLNYLGIGNIDFERSVVIVKQTITVRVNDRFLTPRWFPKSNPPDLHEGVVFGLIDEGNSRNYFVVQIGSDDHLRLSSIDVPSEMIAFEYLDGFLYGLLFEYQDFYRTHTQSIHLVKYSISTGERTREQTFNWNIIEFKSLETPRLSSLDLCRVGQTLFLRNLSKQENKFKIISLDLDSLEWQRSSIPFDKSASSLLSDGGQTLIVCTTDYCHNMQSVYRFVLNQPDKLSNLVWMQLKRIFDARPTSYEFILSQLPTNFKLKCPFQTS